MEKFVQPYDKECMKMAILKHEETFKQQVYELHRLYKIQKMLMKNMPKAQKPQEQKLDSEQQPAGDTKILDECEIELTLGPTNLNSTRRRRRNKPESTTPMNSDSLTTFSSSSTGSSSHVKRVSSFLSSCDEDKEKQMRAPWFYQVLSLNMT